jgi:formate transporter
MENGFPVLDSLLPPAMAEKAEQSGIKKARTDTLTLFALGILAGAFISIGGIFAITVGSGTGTLIPFGLTRLIMGLSFSVGLILVVVGGAELFTGNMLLVMAFANRKVSLGLLLRNWGIVYLGNFTGSLLTAGLVFIARWHELGKGAVGLALLNTGEAKTGLEFWQAIALGILCNAIVCMAVWLTYSSRTTTDKILAIVLPIAAFVAAGFEHSVANMFFIPAALFVRLGASPAFFTAIQKAPADFPHLTWSNFFLANLLPVTIGNIIGGSVLVGLVYWFVYLRKVRAAG